jgi:hypothetical protein
VLLLLQRTCRCCRPNSASTVPAPLVLTGLVGSSSQKDCAQASQAQKARAHMQGVRHNKHTVLHSCLVPCCMRQTVVTQHATQCGEQAIEVVHSILHQQTGLLSATASAVCNCVCCLQLRLLSATAPAVCDSACCLRVNSHREAQSGREQTTQEVRRTVRNQCCLQTASGATADSTAAAW